MAEETQGNPLRHLVLHGKANIDDRENPQPNRINAHGQA